MLKKIIIGTFVFLILIAVTGFLILPAVLKPTLTKKLAENLHRKVSIEDIDINPFIISAKIKGLVIRDPQDQETFASIGELYINLQAAESVLKSALVVEEIKIDKPYVKIIRQTEQQYNFSDLIKNDGVKEDTKKEPFNFFIGNIQVGDGRIDVVDSPKNKQHALTDIAFALPFLSNMKKTANIFVKPYFKANINGTPLVLEGRSKPFAGTLETTFDIDLKRIDIPYYIEYLPKEIEIRIPSGSLDVQASLSYVQSRDKTPVFKVSGMVGLSNLNLTDAKNLPLIRLPQLTINIAESQFMERSVHLSSINFSSPEVYVRRDKSGSINLESIIQKTDQVKEPETTEEKQPFILTIDKLELKNGTFSFSDGSVSDPVNLIADKLEINAGNITTAAGSQGTADISCRVNKKGMVSAKAAFGIDPLLCDAQINIEGLEPAWIQPYFTDKILIIVTGGRASVRGMVALKQDDAKEIQISYKGNVALSDFASVDKEHKDDFIRWKDLSVKGIDAGFNPVYLDIKEIALKDLFSSVIINPDGKLNLSSVAKKDESGQAPDKSEKSSVKKEEITEEKTKEKSVERIEIGRVSLNNCKIRFIDRSINPHYSTELAGIHGSVVGLTSMETEFAKVDLSGRLENTSPLMITGKINPLKEDLFIDLHTSFKDIDLSPASPYSGKFVGYTIHKGKLTLDLKYLIDKKNLDSKNDVFIDQFTFGDSVESPDATSLPVKFAVALLKDRHGKINLNIPVTGRTDDPEFSIWNIIVKILVNLVTKAAAAPFSLIASLYPGAEQLSNIDFEYGRADLPAQSEQKFQLLSKIMTDKPSISLEIKGYAESEKDRQGLTEYLFEKKLKAQKLMTILKKGQPAVALDEITIEQVEYEAFLKEAYIAEKLPKKMNAQGQPLLPPAPDMKKLIVERINVTGSDLKMLAEQRAQQVKIGLLKSEEVKPERIFLVEAELISQEKAGEKKAARVDLNLK